MQHEYGEDYFNEPVDFKALDIPDYPEIVQVRLLSTKSTTLYSHDQFHAALLSLPCLFTLSPIHCNHNIPISESPWRQAGPLLNTLH